MAVNGKRVAILVTEGFEQAEMGGPRRALEDAGAKTEIVSPAGDEVQGWNHYDKGDWFKVDVGVDAANANDYDALLLPGGVANPDQLRTVPAAVDFTRSMFGAGKPAALSATARGPRWRRTWCAAGRSCHGPACRPTSATRGELGGRRGTGLHVRAQCPHHQP